jgi:uncharacterized membrane protein
VIVGFYFDANSVQHGFLLRGGQYTTLDDPAGVLGSVASGLNNRGQVTGGYFDADGVIHGFVLSGGQYTTIDDPAGVLGSGADSINNSGTVVGQYVDANGVTHGYLATKGHDDPASSTPGATSSRGSTAPLMNAFGSFELAIPDSLPPAQGMLSPSGSVSATPRKPDRLPTLPDVSQIDQVFAEDHWGTEHGNFTHSKPKSEGLRPDWLHDGLADDFAGHW